MLRYFRKRTLCFSLCPTTFIDENLRDSLAQISLNPRQTATRRRFVNSEYRAGFAQAQVVEIIKFH